MQEEKLVVRFAGIWRKPLMKMQKSSTVCRYRQKTSDVFSCVHNYSIKVDSTAWLNMRNNTTRKVTCHGSLLLSTKKEHKV